MTFAAAAAVCSARSAHCCYSRGVEEKSNCLLPQFLYYLEGADIIKLCSCYVR